MPKRKKQNQPQPPQHLALSERDEPGDEEDERPMGQPSVNYSPEGRRGEKNYDGPTVKDHPAFWALPPWLTESLVIPSQVRRNWAVIRVLSPGEETEENQ
uniref:Proline rich 3 n=1 Tax=Rattus norvegicus TaxID=10116 RepID=A0ABK0L701_RAT